MSRQEPELAIPRRTKLVKIADARGEKLEDLLPRLVRELGSIHSAAADLGVAPYAVRKRMQQMGYKPQTVNRVEWVQENTEETEHEASFA
jgi:hypothetical protein